MERFSWNPSETANKQAGSQSLRVRKSIVTMPITAKTRTSYLVRLALLTFMCNGAAIWFIYDGAVKYPNQRVRALKYIEFKDKFTDEVELKKEWKAFAAEQGWPTDNPGKPKDQIDFYVQFGMAAAAAPVGLLFLVLIIRAFGRWIEVYETGIRTSWGRELKFEQIVSLDKNKWKSKGIAKVIYEDNGRTSRVVLDDFKYEVKPTEEILKEVESRIDPEIIVGGPPESFKEEEPDSEEQAESSTE
jgi:hypothetical protein